jgi:hypothetical protein
MITGGAEKNYRIAELRLKTASSTLLGENPHFWQIRPEVGHPGRLAFSSIVSTARDQNAAGDPAVNWRATINGPSGTAMRRERWA